jgi:hypothetical protein
MSLFHCAPSWHLWYCPWSDKTDTTLPRSHMLILDWVVFSHVPRWLFLIITLNITLKRWRKTQKIVVQSRRKGQNFVGKPPKSRTKYDKHLESRDLCQIMPSGSLSDINPSFSVFILYIITSTATNQRGELSIITYVIIYTNVKIISLG